MRTVFASFAIVLAAAATAVTATSCKPDPAKSDCLRPFDGVSEHQVNFLSAESAGSAEGDIAIAYWTYADRSKYQGPISARVRLWDGASWSSQLLGTTETVFRGPSFIHHAGRWHAMATLKNAGTGGRAKTLYFRQNDDGSFGTSTLVNALTDNDYLTQKSWAVSSDGTIGVATDHGSNGTPDWTYHTYFSEKSATAGTFVTQQVTFNTSAGVKELQGGVKFVGYDSGNQPFIVYSTPSHSGSTRIPQELRILRRVSSAWQDHLIVATGSLIANNSASGAVGSDGKLVLHYVTSPVSLGPLAQHGVIYDLFTDRLLSDQNTLELANLPDASGYDISTFDVYSSMQMTGPDDGLVVSSWRHPGGFASVYLTRFKPSSGFSGATLFAEKKNFVFNAGSVVASCASDGAAVVAELPTGNASDPYSVYLVDIPTGQGGP